MNKMTLWIGLVTAMLLVGCQNQTDPVAHRDDNTGFEPSTSAPTSSPSTSEASENNFIQTFMGSCVQNFSEFARVEAAAKVQKWKLITDKNQLKMIAPQDDGGQWKAWKFKSGQVGALLSVGSREFEGEKINFCVLIANPIDGNAVRDRIVKMLHAKKESVSQQGGQRYATYIFIHDGKPLLLNFIDGVPMGLKTLNASVTTRPSL
ncbi:hypothetical protein [Sphingobium sp. YR768]|uniref:hypothetical protein n=1 Tax=Sphingobium sp. YR768 TaxID=1884365 RepID=UPI0008ABADBD|nr:hypothetical protein [Sphingobium sp. YR768]SEQ49155.1 hypothetical protein SAMN05518866_101105 [Sphingobium sp. YR768]